MYTSFFFLFFFSIQISKTKLLVKMVSKSGQFANLKEEDLQETIDNKDSKQTKAVIEKSVGIFRSYCESKEYVFLEVEKYTDSEMSSLLRKLYAEVRTKSGNTFSTCLGPISKIVMRYSKTNTTWFISRSSENP